MAWWKSGFGFLRRCPTGLPGVKPPNLSQNAGTHLYGSKYVRLMWWSPHPPSLFSTPVGISKAWWLKQTYTWEHATKWEVCSIKMFYVSVCCLSCIVHLQGFSLNYRFQKWKNSSINSGIYSEESWISWWNCKVAEDHWPHWLIFHALPCWIKKKTIPSAPGSQESWR